MSDKKDLNDWGKAHKETKDAQQFLQYTSRKMHFQVQKIECEMIVDRLKSYEKNFEDFIKQNNITRKSDFLYSVRCRIETTEDSIRKYEMELKILEEEKEEKEKGKNE